MHGRLIIYLLIQNEYLSMSQLINVVGKILEEHCEQDSKTYQSGVIQVEEEGRNAILKQVWIYRIKCDCNVIIY